MNVEKLIAIVSILITLSVASERLVEIIKGFIPSLNREKTDPDAEASPKQEAWRKAKISLLAVAAGIVTAFLASPLLAGVFKDLSAGSTCSFIVGFGADGLCGFDFTLQGFAAVLGLGLLASGGSSLWNSVLEYLLKIKDLKKIRIEEERVETARKRVELDLVKRKDLELRKSDQAPGISPFEQS